MSEHVQHCCLLTVSRSAKKAKVAALEKAAAAQAAAEDAILLVRSILIAQLWHAMPGSLEANSTG